jgi:predicted DNA binding CopG/RHH family protein
VASNLTKEEQEILDSYERGEWVSIADKEGLGKYRAAAKATFKKDKRVNIRMSGRDLELIQERALIEGLPYQTLMSSVLHKFVNGSLVDISQIKAKQ